MQFQDKKNYNQEISKMKKIFGQDSMILYVVCLAIIVKIGIPWFHPYLSLGLTIFHVHSDKCIFANGMLIINLSRKIAINVIPFTVSRSPSAYFH